MIGKTIGKYRIVGQLGRGGMGTVYRAVDEVLDREVAIKVLNAELADTDMVERFRTEAITLAKLNHPDIATIYELFRTETDLLMVMELVHGETLDKISDRFGALAPEHAAYLIDKVLSALAHAHRAGIVHRDMKPANVMVTEYGGVKIMDFGVATVRGAERADGGMRGTPAYMSPEQVLGHEVDGRADLYSLGVVFYRLLTGSLPFEADTTTAMVRKQISDAPMALHWHRAGLPDWCEAILQLALAKSPADRFQTAEEFRETLGKVAGLVTTEMTSAPDTGGAPPALSGANALARAAESATVVLPKRHSALAGSLLAILAGGVTVFTILALRYPAVASMTATADRPPPTTQNAKRSTPRPTSLAPGTGQPIVPAAALPASSAIAAAPGTPPSAASTSAPTRRARRSHLTSADVTATSSTPMEPVKPAGRTFAVPFVFGARALVSDGDHQREREFQVVLSDGKINMQANDDQNTLPAVPYDQVLSISYSRGRDPLWNAPEGPAQVARVGGGLLGIFRGERHCVSLRTKNTNGQFVVLRLGNDEQMRRAIVALEERTGRNAELVAQRKDDK